MRGGPYIEKEGDIQKKENMLFRRSMTFAIVTSKFKWNSSTNKAGPRKDQTGRGY